MNIKDIAKICGVGVATVSRVINNHPDVKKETREKVLDVIREYNYIPNNSAQILKKNSTKNIGVLVKGVYNPFFSEMLKDISSKIETYGYTMILQHNDNNDKQDVDSLKAFIKEKRLQGALCLGGNFVEVNDESFMGIDAPIVLLSVNTERHSKSKRYSCIGIDNRLAAYEATHYLVKKGHKHIALILGDKYDEGIGNLRQKGYEKSLRENDIEIRDEYRILGEYNADKAYEETKKLLSKFSQITAMFVISDVMAMGVARAIIDMGMRIPEDISIVGFDGMDLAKYYTPRITTLKQPRRQMAMQGVELLLGLINEEEENKQVLLDTKLVEGESCKSVESIDVKK